MAGLKKYLISALLICSAVALRINYLPQDDFKKVNVTTYDAFGYYIYLPSIFVYNDYKNLTWLDSLDKKYHLIGGNWLYQAKKSKKGEYVFKYPCGVALMELPFFTAADWYAKNSKKFEADGFSFPYQIALIVAAIFYFSAGLMLLSKVLYSFFSEFTANLTLASIILASNILQYVSIDSAMSHGFTFFWYGLMIYLCQKWSSNPNKWLSMAMGICAGAATLCRPSEAIIVLIPLLWKLNDFTILSKEHWKKYKGHFAIAMLSGFITFLPQMLYWQSTTGQLLFDTGSKWTFLNPWWRVLFGWEKGWFVYTPITIFGILGLFYLKKYAFNKSVIWFMVINIWIVISWFDWQYGASYSCRGLSHSLPVLSMSLAAFFESLVITKIKKYIACGLISSMILLNQFQIWQYNETILHYSKMNWTYYKNIFLNPSPNELELSTMENPIYIDTSDYQTYKISSVDIQVLNYKNHQIADKLNSDYIQIDFTTRSNPCFWDGRFHFYVVNQSGDTICKSEFGAFNYLTRPDGKNHYSFFMKNGQQASLEAGYQCIAKDSILLNDISLTGFNKKQWRG